MKTKRKKQVQVLPRDGKWIVQRKDAKKVYRVVDTQAEGITIGRRIAMNSASELYVYRLDGSLRSKDSFGDDPFPLRHTKGVVD